MMDMSDSQLVITVIKCVQKKESAGIANTLIPCKLAVPNSRFSLTRSFVSAIFLQTRGFRLSNSRFLRVF